MLRRFKTEYTNVFKIFKSSYKNDIKLVKDEPQVLRFENVQLSKGADAAAVKLIFDLGGCPEDLEFSVTDITLIKKAQ